MSIKLAVEHFQRFTSVYKKNSRNDVKKFERDCINKILKVKKKEDSYVVTITNQSLSDLILELFSEPENKKDYFNIVRKRIYNSTSSKRITCSKNFRI